MGKTQVTQKGKLWIAHLLTPYGHMELILGEDDRPDGRGFVLVERLLEGPEDHIAEIRRHLLFRWLWRPIRFAINKEGRLSVQFQNRLTNKRRLLFADEHSAFKLQYGEVPESKLDAERYDIVMR